jgi:2'-5' RNA ligase
MNSNSYHTRSAAAARFACLSETERKDWIADGPRVVKLMRTRSDDLLKLMAEIRRAYRTKPIAWITEAFEPRLTLFRDQAKWFADQLRRHPMATYQPEFEELRVVVEEFMKLLIKVRTNA